MNYFCYKILTVRKKKKRSLIKKEKGVCYITKHTTLARYYS